mmetsp:Transcript_2692/g.4044  ORF Transcript_2692/g.4044 Transcript_2692/m.4044 type:complete len:538 (+) Transcript_2692:191-1804(+)|eukprot:CAMPEP_0185026454 /NCGR_PEP_ID=MMETSP1103-20130426/10678_1 /TAXON_ID=36769 /ORGANISM="Paraphysomonas bandaiensis, Strain Caron Lab Isolate" /LENGTH=537 /DNA_ID=CAMNT_0027560045 /DNA_START=104 /DNA_END=1717 /DNA_ORIENTATION=+
MNSHAGDCFYVAEISAKPAGNMFLDEHDSAGSFPDIPISYDSLREQVYGGLMPDARQYWWPLLPRIVSGEHIRKYPNIKAMSTVRYKSALGGRVSVDTNDTGAEQTNRLNEVVCLLSDLYDIQDQESVRQLVGVLIDIIPSSDICFHTCCDILDQPHSIVARNAHDHRVKLHVFRELIEEHLPQADVVLLTHLGVLEDRFLNLIFVDFFTSIISNTHVLRIFDMLLLEGVVVLHRFGLGIIFMHISLLYKVKSGQEFWEEVCRHSWDFDFDDLFKASLNIGKSPFSLFFRKGFAVQTAELHEYEVQVQEDVAEEMKKTVDAPRRRTSSAESTIQFGIASNSRLVDVMAAHALHTSIPDSFKMDSFRLVFSTYNNGWSLDTLYALTQHMYPCILLLRSLEKKVVLGAFLPCALSPPSKKLRGNGLTCCFRLRGIDIDCYRWRHTRSALNNSDDPETSESDSTHQQFAICTAEYIIFGGSAKHGTNAIRIDSDLRTCYCGPSDTYNNPPLAPEEQIQPFAIDELEVFCGPCTERGNHSP